MPRTVLFCGKVSKLAKPESVRPSGYFVKGVASMKMIDQSCQEIAVARETLKRRRKKK